MGRKYHRPVRELLTRNADLSEGWVDALSEGAGGWYYTPMGWSIKLNSTTVKPGTFNGKDCIHFDTVTGGLAWIRMINGDVVHYNTLKASETGWVKPQGLHEQWLDASTGYGLRQGCRYILEVDILEIQNSGNVVFDRTGSTENSSQVWTTTGMKTYRWTQGANDPVEIGIASTVNGGSAKFTAKLYIEQLV